MARRPAISALKKLRPRIEGYVKRSWRDDAPLMLFSVSTEADMAARALCKRKTELFESLWDYTCLLPHGYSAGWAALKGQEGKNHLVILSKDGKYPTGWASVADD